MKDFLLETFPNPDRKGCPDEKTIQAIAEDRSPLTEAVGMHIGSCSECYAEYRNFRKDWEESVDETPAPLKPVEIPRITVAPQRAHSRLVAMGIAASLLVICSGGYVLYRGSNHTEQVAMTAHSSGSQPVSARVDLFESGTLRGGDEESLTPLNQVTLPASVVHLSVVLPRFSDKGTYRLNVSTDKQGKNVIASATGEAVQSDGEKITLPVTLDLRDAKAGAYFLATVRGTDNGTYYYPLQIR